MASSHWLLETDDPFPDRLTQEVAQELTKLARSQRNEDVDMLIQIGMTRGLRHPRFAIQAIEAQLGQRFAEETVDLTAQSLRLARLLLWATALSAVAAVASVIAIVLD